jgi:crotonobetainyl-CoA:carnitine CoA-transferase CaiB-like acyl-CoA transferase
LLGQALSDVRVLDLTWYIAGPYCTKLLADYGADVIKIEKHGEGDPARRMGPFFQDDPHLEKSGLFLYLNTNKRGITLNLKSQTGKKIFEELVKNVDILVESFSPGVMERLGLSFKELEKINPKLVMTSISNFGQTGPYRDYKSSDLITFAMGGAMNSTGTQDRPPVGVTRNVKMYEAGWLAAIATTAAGYGAQKTGLGDHIDVSLMEAQLGSTDRRDTHLLSYAYTGFTTPREDLTTARWTVVSSGYLRCKDGWVLVICPPVMWPKMCRALGRPELMDDPRFQNLYDLTYASDIDGILAEWLSTRTKQQATEEMQAAGVAVTPINTPEDVVKDPHLNARGFWVRIDHPVVGEVTYPGAPMDMSEGGFQVRMPAPLLGQHNIEVYGKLGYSRQDMVRLRAAGVI